MSEAKYPSIKSLVLVPAVITLAVTLLRLSLEISGSAAWLASTESGGGAALLGISWLPLIFGPYFAIKLQQANPGAPGLLKRLFKTLLVYGLWARIPVVAVTIPALFFAWGTHYEKFPFEGSNASYIATAFAVQLGFWACIWTPLAGMLTGAIVLKLRSGKTSAKTA